MSTADRERMIDGLLERRFPGMTEDVEVRARKLAGSYGSDEADVRVAEVLMGEFSLNVRMFRGASRRSGKKVPVDVSGVQNWLRAATRFRVELESMSDAQLIDTYNDVFSQAKLAAEEARKNADAGLFFSSKSAQADFSKWNKIPAWSPDEAVALSLGKDPAVVNSKSLLGTPHGSPFAREFRRRLDIVKRGISARQLVDPIERGKFVDWLPTTDFDVPEEIGMTDSLSRRRTGEEKISSFVAKLLLGMAMSKYHFDFDYGPSKGSTVFVAVSKDLATLGIDVSHETIKTYLRMALKIAKSRGYHPKTRHTKRW